MEIMCTMSGEMQSYSWYIKGWHVIGPSFVNWVKLLPRVISFLAPCIIFCYATTSSSPHISDSFVFRSQYRNQFRNSTNTTTWYYSRSAKTLKHTCWLVYLPTTILSSINTVICRINTVMYGSITRETHMIEDLDLRGKILSRLNQSNIGVLVSLYNTEHPTKADTNICVNISQHISCTFMWLRR